MNLTLHIKLKGGAALSILKIEGSNNKMEEMMILSTAFTDINDIEEISEKANNLLEEKKLKDLRQLLCDIHPKDIALVMENLPEDKILIVFRLLPKELAAQTFVEMDSVMQKFLIDVFNDRELEEVIDELFVDDTVDLIEEMPANVVTRILAHTDSEMRGVINQILHYPKDSAGSIMTIEFVELKAAMTISEAFSKIRSTGVDKETIYTCYVTDEKRKLIGLVTAKDLLLSEDDVLIEEIMEKNVISVTTLEDKENVANIFSKYDFLALPVVDNENRLVGIITVDDAMDVMTDEVNEDIEMMAAITPTEKSYIKTGVFETFRKRIPWLLLLMVSATFTSKILTHFETALAAQVALTAFIPMLMDTGGNAGSQSSVTVIRGLSLGEIGMRDIFKIMGKETVVAFFCGITLAAVNFAKMMVIDHTSIKIAVVVCLTLICVVLISKLSGCVLPIFAKKIGFDPAVMASPFITTIVDTLALLVYFKIASLILHI